MAPTITARPPPLLPAGDLIPPPHVVRSRLFEARAEVAYLRRLLRLSEDRAAFFPDAEPEADRAAR